MKKMFLSLFLIPAFAFSQKIEENKIDEFTKAAVKRTTWEIISKGSLSRPYDMYCHARVSKIDGVTFLDLRIISGSGAVFSLQKDAKIMFKMDNDSIVTLLNIKFVVTCSGCGATGYVGSSAQGLEASFVLPTEEFNDLKTHSIKKIRLYASDGYIETDMQDKWKDVIKNELLII